MGTERYNKSKNPIVYTFSVSRTELKVIFIKHILYESIKIVNKIFLLHVLVF